MLETPLFTADNLAELNAALSTGAMLVKYSDKTVEYRTQNEMLSLRRMMISELFPAKKCASMAFVSFDKGVY